MRGGSCGALRGWLLVADAGKLLTASEVDDSVFIFGFGGAGTANESFCSIVGVPATGVPGAEPPAGRVTLRFGREGGKTRLNGFASDVGVFVSSVGAVSSTLGRLDPVVEPGALSVETASSAAGLPRLSVLVLTLVGAVVADCTVLVPP